MATLTLKHPIGVGKSTISKLEIREHVVAEDLLAFDLTGPNKQTIALIANLSGTDEEVIKKLHISDYQAADKICTKLLDSEPAAKNENES